MKHRAAVLGSPIDHSLSPALHLAAYRALGLDWTYDAVDVGEGTLEGFLRGLDDSWAGLSLTRPLKQAVIPLLAEVDPVAALIGAVNTVVPVGIGWRGVNTDVFGIVASIHSLGLDPPDTATVLGAGATARSAIAAAAELGVAVVTVCSRRPEPARECTRLAETLGMIAQSADLTPDAALAGADLLVSTLPGDAAGAWAQVVGGATGMLLDASYHPWPTPLAVAWPHAGVASGRDMLLWQATEQVRLFTGIEPPVAAMALALPA